MHKMYNVISFCWFEKIFIIINYFKCVNVVALFNCLITNYIKLIIIYLCRWKQKQLTDGLLILDDVCSNKIVKFLDIGCKILITTNDMSIMDDIIDTRVKYLKVNEGFEEKETLDLFSKCLSVDLKSLPSHASRLHSICKGITVFFKMSYNLNLIYLFI